MNMRLLRIALLTVTALGVAAPAFADPPDHHDHDRYEHHDRDFHDHYRRYSYNYYNPDYVYAPPPVVYAPPPPPPPVAAVPSLNFVLPLNIR